MKRLLITLGALLLGTVTASAHFDLPSLPSREQYGNILIDRNSTKSGVQPVTFSHWLHRKRHTCRVCHTELDFSMKAGTTEISERENRAGKFCGACHNGKVAFRHNGNCDKCHNGNIDFGSEKFTEFFNKPFPTTPYGNGVNWVESLRRGMITPATYLKTKSKDLNFDKLLILEAEWSIISPSIFPHKAHIEWLDCSSCHPDIFNIKKKTTKHFSMSAILSGEFCGVCHLTVAFPMDDCQRCHPGMKGDANQ